MTHFRLFNSTPNHSEVGLKPAGRLRESDMFLLNIESYLFQYKQWIVALSIVSTEDIIAGKIFQIRSLVLVLKHTSFADTQIDDQLRNARDLLQQ